MRVVCLACCVALLLLSFFARADVIGVYGDFDGQSRCLSPPLSGPFDVFVVHHATQPRGGLSFRVDGWLVGGLSVPGWDFPPDWRNPPDGNPFLYGIMLDYGGDICVSGDTPLLTIHMMATGPIPGDQCQFMRIAGYDRSLYPHVLGCGATPDEDAEGGVLYLTPERCEQCPTVATTQSTWGAVKALYR